jgi:hypothetical protein
MEFNTYTWSLYKDSKKGQDAIRIFEEGAIADKGNAWDDTLELLDKYLDESDDRKQNLSYLVYELCDHARISNKLDEKKAEKYFENIVQKGIQVHCIDKETRGNIDIEITKPEELLALIAPISVWLYFECPQFFKPYFFCGKFYELTKITDTFGIELPKTPLKQYKEDRLRYYWELNKTFFTFQKKYRLSDAEFCAFLYDFAPNCVDRVAVKKLPQPTNVWLCGGNKFDFKFLDACKNDRPEFWQGNIDTKIGDIIVMYCLSPRSCIHSVWRAASNGIADPFFCFYSEIFINNGQKIPPISLRQLKRDKHFKKHSLIKKNMQGVNGYSFTSEDYGRLLFLIARKGGDTSVLPKLYNPVFSLNKSLKDERAVEITLIEPFLKKIGYTHNDWIRQLPVRIGRGERVFPDYAFLTHQRNKEKSFMLIESKYWIKNNRDLEDAFVQVRSYGLQLSANILLIADKNAIRIYERREGNFDRMKYLTKFWEELESPDEFRKIKKLILKHEKKHSNKNLNKK